MVNTPRGSDLGRRKKIKETTPRGSEFKSKRKPVSSGGRGGDPRKFMTKPKSIKETTPRGSEFKSKRKPIKETTPRGSEFKPKATKPTPKVSKPTPKVSKPTPKVTSYSIKSGDTLSQIAKKAGTTRGIQWISFSSFKILDSPGVIPNYEWDEVKLALIGAKTVQHIKNPEKVAIGILEMFLKKSPESLKNFYNINLDNEVYDIFEDIGSNKRFLRKGGKIDEMRTAVAIVNDWQKGKLRL